MLLPKSLFTLITDSFLKPVSSAYFAATVPWSASEVMVRKNQPPVFPCSARFVKLGEEEAGEICTTPLGAVTEVRIGFETFWPYSPAGPVSSITTPMVVVHAA